jgi:hypothetical protein
MNFWHTKIYVLLFRYEQMQTTHKVFHKCTLQVECICLLHKHITNALFSNYDCTHLLCVHFLISILWNGSALHVSNRSSNTCGCMKPSWLQCSYKKSKHQQDTVCTEVIANINKYHYPHILRDAMGRHIMNNIWSHLPFSSFTMANVYDNRLINYCTQFLLPPLQRIGFTCPWHSYRRWQL